MSDIFSRLTQNYIPIFLLTHLETKIIFKAICTAMSQRCDETK